MSEFTLGCYYLFEFFSMMPTKFGFVPMGFFKEIKVAHAPWVVDRTN